MREYRKGKLIITRNNFFKSIITIHDTEPKHTVTERLKTDLSGKHTSQNKSNELNDRCKIKKKKMLNVWKLKTSIMVVLIPKTADK